MPVNAIRRKRVLEMIPEGVVATRAWLMKQGISRHALENLVKSEQLKSVANGVYSRADSKPNVLHTNERLTQPKKIAIVYFDDNNGKEYVGFINQLQQAQILLHDLEYLDLEELQGVAGLKALRVGVNFEV